MVPLFVSRHVWDDDLIVPEHADVALSVASFAVPAGEAVKLILRQQAFRE